MTQATNAATQFVYLEDSYLRSEYPDSNLISQDIAAYLQSLEIHPACIDFERAEYLISIEGAWLDEKEGKWGLCDVDQDAIATQEQVQIPHCFATSEELLIYYAFTNELELPLKTYKVEQKRYYFFLVSPEDAVSLWHDSRFNKELLEIDFDFDAVIDSDEKFQTCLAQNVDFGVAFEDFSEDCMIVVEGDNQSEQS